MSYICQMFEESEINDFIELLSIPSYYGQEDRMVEYISTVIKYMGLVPVIDEHNNIYVTKGISDSYPCIVAHTDTVHPIKDIEIIKNGNHLEGVIKGTKIPTGLGGDDKCGIFIALQLLKSVDNIKVAFFVSEEIGCLGSLISNPVFFENVSYVIQFDAPGINWVSESCMGIKLFTDDGDFITKIKEVLNNSLPNYYFSKDPYTDVMALRLIYNLECINMSAGYYNMHSDKEYVIIDDVYQMFTVGFNLVNVLGNENFSQYSYNDDSNKRKMAYSRLKEIKTRQKVRYQ